MFLMKLGLARDMRKLILSQRELLKVRDEQIEILKQQLLRQQLINERRYLDLVITFRRQLDEPDYDLHEKLEGMICDVSDFVARMEEQVL